MKRLLKLTALIALSVSVLSACNSGTGSKSTGTGSEIENTPVESQKPAEPISLNIALTGAGLPDPGTDVLKQELDAKLGTNLMLTATQTSEDYDNKMRVQIAGGNYPDLFQASYTDMKTYAEKGLLLDLTPYLDNELKQAKDFVTDLGADLWKKASINGKVYAVPRNGDVPFNSYWIRKDWLDKLQLDMPQTIDELLEVAKSFTEQDPDENGKKDTYGITGLELNAFAPIFGAYGISEPGTGVFFTQDGKLMNSYSAPAMSEALATIKKFIDANVTDPELMTNKVSNAQQKAFQGKAGIIYLGWTDIAKDEMIEQYRTVNPDAEWVQLGAPKGPAGQFDGSFDFDKPSRLMVIPKSLENDKEKLQKVFDLINYLSSPEGNKLVMYGLEGKHYTMENGKEQLTELMAKEGGYFYMYQLTGRPNEQYLVMKFPKQESVIAFAANAERIRLLDSSVVPPSDFNKADADRFAKEELVKFVYGKRPLSEFGQFLSTLDGTFKYQLYTEAAEKQIKEQGLID